MNSGLVDYIEFIWHGMKLGLSYFLLDELLQVYELWMAIFYGGITMGRGV